VLGGLAALVPDLDHPDSVFGQLLPDWWHRLTPGHRGVTHSLAWCLALALLGRALQGLLADGDPAPLPALALLAGALSHVLADGLTVAGVPLWWPLRRRHVVFLGALAFPTHSWRETVVVLGVVAAVAYWVAG
jgi:inner membrane protein